MVLNLHTSRKNEIQSMKVATPNGGRSESATYIEYIIDE